MAKEDTNNIVVRPPVITILGHVDHGKSTLLDYIRKTNIVEDEVGGITQHISAYEVEHTDKDGNKKRITFLDTPGHAAFQAMRSRGARAGDIAILIVAADDGANTQTLEAFKAIQDAKIPFIVAINKIDVPGADINKTIESLIENEIYLEGYGGDTPYVEISAKTGENIDELLDVILLVAELEEFTGNPEANASGVVIETNVDPQKGISATLVIKNGSLRSGMYIQAGKSTSPVRIMEDHNGNKIENASFSSPIRITGFDTPPGVGAPFTALEDRPKAKEAADSYTSPQRMSAKRDMQATTDEHVTIPVIIKADARGSVEAIEHEIGQIEIERSTAKIIEAGVGAVTENDVRLAGAHNNALIVGFHVKIEGAAERLAERMEVEIKNFDIIYELSTWLKEAIQKRTPKIEVEEEIGKAKVKKVFNTKRERQIVGGKVVSGTIAKKERFNILRREEEIGNGAILELQKMKKSADEISSGNEFGAKVESTMEIAPGDILQVYKVIEK